MKRKYFCYKKETTLTWPSLYEPFVIPADQPFLVGRILDEYGYIYPAEHLGCETSFNDIYFWDGILPEEEIKMYKIYMEFYRNQSLGHLRDLSKESNKDHKKIMELWDIINEQQGVIDSLQHGLSYKIKKRK